jgi:hypothetical protein
MLPEVTCPACHTRQTPWNLTAGDIGPCRNCGAPLAQASEISRQAAPISNAADMIETAIRSGPISDRCVTATPPRENDIVPGIGDFEQELKNRGWRAISSDRGLRWLVVLLLFCIFVFAHSWAVQDWFSRQWNSLRDGDDRFRYFAMVLSFSFGILISLMLISRMISISSDDPVWGSVCVLVLFVLAVGTYFLGYEVGYRVAPGLQKQQQFGKSIGAIVTASFASSPAEKKMEVEPVAKPGPTPQELDFILGKQEKP